MATLEDRIAEIDARLKIGGSSYDAMVKSLQGRSSKWKKAIFEPRSELSDHDFLVLRILAIEGLKALGSDVQH